MKKISTFLCFYDNIIPYHYQIDYVVFFHKKEHCDDEHIININVEFCKSNDINYIIRRNNSNYVINSILIKNDILIYVPHNNIIPNYIETLIFIFSNLNYNKISIYKNNDLYLYLIKQNKSNKFDELMLEDDILNTLEFKDGTEVLIKNIKINKYICETDLIYPLSNQKSISYNDIGTKFYIFKQNNDIIIKKDNEYLHSHHIKVSLYDFETTLTDILDNSSLWSINKLSIKNKHMNSYLCINYETKKITTKYRITNEWIIEINNYD